MMFIREADMALPVIRWLDRQGLTVKREFVVPWGICDLVGLAFNKRNVRHRETLRQRASLGSLTRASLLFQIPDIETGKSVTLKELSNWSSPALSQDELKANLLRLQSLRFVIAKGHAFQKVNGWMPLHRRLVAVELKLERIEEVLAQARNNLGFATESYIAVPHELAKRVLSAGHYRHRLADTGIGLLSVQRNRCSALLKARISQSPASPELQLYCADKFWAQRPTDN